MGYHDVISTILAFVIPLAWFGLFLLLFRLTCKLKWLTAVCLAVIAGTIPSLLGVSLFAESLPKRWVCLLPAAVCAVILIIQFFGWLASGEDSTVNAAEREKILRMVEDGKISAEEGSELLDAMGRSTALRGQEKFSRLDFVTLIGAALVILGFFLPWVYIHMRSPVVYTWGYQAGHQVGALGWTIFIIGILSAVPVFVTPKDFLYKISMLQIFLILIGLVLVISVLVRAGHNLGAGLIFCLAGFIIELFASAVKFKRLAA